MCIRDRCEAFQCWAKASVQETEYNPMVSGTYWRLILLVGHSFHIVCDVFIYYMQRNAVLFARF